MRVFQDYDDIFGKNKAEDLNETMHEFFSLAVGIRHSLGDQAYLLDYYVCTILKSAGEIVIEQAVTAGHKAASELRSICMAVIDGNPGYCEHPLYNEVKGYIQAHPHEQRERGTRLNLYFIETVGILLPYATQNYYELQEETHTKMYDMVYVHNIYEKISDIVGLDTMRRLNELLHRRFLVVKPLKAFQQAIVNDLLDAMLYRDIESSKLPVQLWLERIK